jgi:ligand-binding sensor domain-containing protein
MKAPQFILLIATLVILIPACNQQTSQETTSAKSITNTATNTPIPTKTASPSPTVVPTRTESPSQTPTPQPLAVTIDVPACVANETSDKKTFDAMLDLIKPHLNEMESYRYHTIYQYQVEGEYPEEALSVEVEGTHAGRLPTISSESDDPVLAANLYEASQVKLIDLRTGYHEEVIVNNNGFWAHVDGDSGWIEFAEADPADILILPDIFSPQSIATGGLEPYVSLISEQPPLMSKTEEITDQEVIHRCWVVSAAKGFYDSAINHSNAYTILSEAEVHLWTSEEDTQFIRMAITGSHWGECIGDCDNLYQHDVQRDFLLWMELSDVGDAIEIEVPDEEQVALRIPLTGSESIGDVSAPISELPLPDDAIKIYKPYTGGFDHRYFDYYPEDSGKDPREYPFIEPREYLVASIVFVNELMETYANQGWYHTPMNQRPNYQTEGGFTETARFYLDGMGQRGWQLKGNPLQLGMTELFLFFEKENIVFPVILSPDGTGGTFISAFLPPDAEVMEAVNTGWTIYTIENSELSCEFLMDMDIDQEGRVWITSACGLDVLEESQWSHHDQGGGWVAPIGIDWEGNVWVANNNEPENGLAKFDGQTWTSIDLKDGIRDIKDIFIDAPDKIWISLETEDGNGLGVLEGDDFTYFSNEEIGFQDSYIVTSLVRDPMESVWVSTDSGGLFVFDGNDWRSEQNPICPYLQCFDKDMLIDQQGWLWISEPGKMQVFNGQEWAEYSSESGLPFPNIERIAVDQHNRLWAASHYGLLSVLETNGQWITYTPKEDLGLFYIDAIEVDPLGRIWLATLDGVLVFDPPEPSSTQIREFPAPITAPPIPDPLQEPQTGWTRYTIENSLLPSNLVSSLVVDREDRVWIGTDSGVSVFLPDGSQTTYSMANSPLEAENIRVLAFDSQDRLLIGTCHGLTRLDTDGTWTLFPPDEGLWYPIEEVPKGVRLIYPCVESLAMDNEGRLWMGNNPGGTGSAISVMDEDENWKIYIPENSGLPEDHIYTMAVDEQGQIWIGTWEGISVLGDDGQWETTSMSDLGIVGEYESVTEMLFDDKDRLWIGTTAGLVVKDPGGSLTKYTTSDSDLISDYIQALMIDSEGRVWIGTAEGLSIMETDGTWTNHPSDNSLLPLGGITDLAMDQQGRVWAGTPWGVSVLDP